MTPTDHSLSIRDLMVTLVTAGLSYLRWTQFVPMITAWCLLSIMLGTMVLANFQERTFSVLMEAEALYVRLFGEDPAGGAARNDEDGAAAAAPPAASSGAAQNAKGPDAADAADAAEPEEGALVFGGEDLRGWIWRGWSIAALIGWLLGGLWRLLFGPSDPWPLRRKLLICGMFAGACSLVLMALWGVGREIYHGAAAGWIALFVGGPLLVWLVSAWSLGVSHLLGAFADQLKRAQQADEVRR